MGCLRHDSGTVPSDIGEFDDGSKLLLPALADTLLCLSMDDDVVGNRRINAVVGEGISSTSTCCPRLTDRSPGHSCVFAWFAITHVVVGTISQL